MERNMPKESTRIDEFLITGFSGDYVFRTIKEKGTFYESETLELWTPQFGKLDTILDVGANLGNHTLFWSRTAKHIYSFEPYGPNYENLLQNIRQNHLEQVVTAVQKAVGREEGHAILTEFDDSNFGATTFQMDNEQRAASYEVISLDQFVQDARLSSVDLIKIDTEGFETDVLQGALTLIRKLRPVIWVEVSHQTFEVVMEILKAQQYDLADVEGFNMLFFPKEKNVNGLHIEHKKLLSALFLYETKSNTYYKNYEVAKDWHQASVAKAEALRAECDRLRERCDAAEKNYQTAKEWHEASASKAEALQAECDGLRERCDAAEKNYQTAKKWHEASASKAEALKAECDGLRERCDAAEKNYQTEKEWHEASTLKAEALKAECDGLRERCDAAEKNYQTEKEWHEASVSKAEALQAERDRLERMLKEKQEFQLENVQMISAFISQDMQTEELLNQLMGQMNKLQAQASYLKKENTAYREKLDKIKSVWYGRLGIAVYKKSQELSRRIRTKFKG